jgi:hypothetical protein
MNIPILSQNQNQSDFDLVHQQLIELALKEINF